MLHMTQKIENNIPSWWSYVSVGDDVLLMGDAVYAMQKNPINHWIQQTQAAGQNFYALLTDVKARGLDQQSILAGVVLLTDDEWVALVEKNSCVQTW